MTMEGLDVLAPGSCPHRPISNGYSCVGGDQRALCWCGRCQSFAYMDEEWVRKYAKAHPNVMGKKEKSRRLKALGTLQAAPGGGTSETGRAGFR